MIPPSPSPIDQTALAAVAAAFPLQADLIDGRPHGHGLINDTFVINCDQAGSPLRYIFQRINHNVFRNVPALMENIQRVTAHLSARPPVTGRQPLRLIPTLTQQDYHLDPHGYHWRCYNFIEKAESHDVITTLAQARAAAFAYGEFQCQLADLTGPRLHETIPNFHHTRRRFEALLHSISADVASRVAEVGPEIEFALNRQPLANALLDPYERGEIPERITHNDTKISNVMLDDATGEGVCVIDLDTVMPGLALYDFGDLVRSATNPVLEDETDLSRVKVQLPIFEQLVAGYLASARPMLNDTEIAHLVVSGQLLAFEIGIRFLTDYLNGDTYYKIKHPRHNLDRTRGQFALLKSMEDTETEMQRIVTQQLNALGG
jgi:hypothetical protein